MFRREAITRKGLPWLSLLCAAAITLAACGSSSSSGSSSGNSAGSSGGNTASASASSSASAGGGNTAPINVALPEPYSGSAASLGQYTDQAFALAMAQYGSKVGNRPIHLIKGDTQCTPSVAVQAVHQLVPQHPAAAISPACSGDTLAMKPALIAAKLPMVSMDLVPGIVDGDPYMWDVAPTMAQINGPFAKYITSTTGAKNVGILHDTTAYGQGCEQSMVAGLKSAGAKVGVDAAFGPSDTDFSGQILSAKRAGVQAVYIEGYSEQLGKVISQARQLGLTVPIFASLDIDDSAAFKAGGKALNGVIFASDYLPTSLAASQAFSKAWQDKYHSVPGEDVESIYEPAVVIIKALEAAGPNATTDDINKAIAATNVQLPAGTVKFGSDRLRINPKVYLGKVVNDQPVLVKTL